MSHSSSFEPAAQPGVHEWAVPVPAASTVADEFVGPPVVGELAGAVLDEALGEEVAAEEGAVQAVSVSELGWPVSGKRQILYDTAFAEGWGMAIEWRRVLARAQTAQTAQKETGQVAAPRWDWHSMPCWGRQMATWAVGEGLACAM